MSELIAVIPYYNFCKQPWLLENHLKQVRDLDRQGVENVTYELSVTGQFEMPDDINSVKISSRSIMWHKEDLINKAASELPHKNIAWLDSGILLSDGWAEKVVKKLEKTDIIQCFSHLYWYARRGGIIEGTGPGTMFGKKLNKIYSTGFGGAWAARREFFDEIGLFPFNIVGGGDIIVCSALLGLHSTVTLDRYSNAHYDAIIDWIERVRRMNLKSDFIYGQFKHLWHGSMRRRQYIQRSDILKHYNFNPSEDVRLENGILEWSSGKVGMYKCIVEYMMIRNG